MLNIPQLLPAALACAVCFSLPIASAEETISVYEHGGTRITTNDAPTLIQVSEDRIVSMRPTITLNESVNASGAPELQIRVSVPVDVPFGDWSIASSESDILTFSPGLGHQIEVGNYVVGPRVDQPQLRLSYEVAAFSGRDPSQGPWLSGDITFNIKSLERNASGQIESLLATYSASSTGAWRRPNLPGVTGSIAYNVPVSSVPEGGSVALMLAGLLVAGAATRRRADGRHTEVI